MEKAIFFPSIEGDRKYSAQDLADTIGGLVTNGVYSRTATNLKAEAAGGMNITLHPGLCVINGRVGINKNPVTLTPDAADGVLNRIDRVVICCDYNTREFREYIKKGTPASSPTAPALQRDADAYEIAIADIAVAAGTAVITQLMITDTRASGILCGYVDFAANPGLQELFTEMQAQIDALLSGLNLGNLPASAITSGVFDPARLPGASTSGAGIAQLNSAVNSVLESQAATPKAIKTVNDKVTDLERSQMYIIASNAGGNNFTAPDTSVNAYTNGLRRTVYFTAASEAPQLNINGKGYRPVLQANGVPLKVKAYQMVDVIAENTVFFAVRSGGGVELPSTITAGATIIHTKLEIIKNPNPSTYGNLPAGWGVTILKAGIYRFFYSMVSTGGATLYLRLVKNGTLVADSEITNNFDSGEIIKPKIIDVSAVAGDQIRLQGRSGPVGCYISGFGVGIIAQDVQGAFNELLIAL